MGKRTGLEGRWDEKCGWLVVDPWGPQQPRNQTPYKIHEKCPSLETTQTRSGPVCPRTRSFSDGPLPKHHRHQRRERRAPTRRNADQNFFREWNEVKHSPRKTCASCLLGIMEVPFHRDPATTFATAHPSNEDHRIRHACSTRLCMSSLRARALANPVKEPFVSFENLPPTSTSRTTNQTRACTAQRT